MKDLRRDPKGYELRDGEGYIVDDNGKIRYRYRKQVNGKTICVYANSLKKLRKIVDNRNRVKAYDDLEDMTLNEARDIYVDTIHISDSTRANYNSIWRNMVADTIGRQNVNTIKQMTIKQYYTGLAKAGYSNNAVREAHNHIRATLDMLYQDEIIPRNPASISISKYGRPAAKKEALTMEEQEKMLDYISSSNIYAKYYDMIVLELELGLRMGELLGLQWSDVDFKNKSISVDHQLIYRNYGEGSELHIVKPKTAAGIRTIPLSKRAYNAICNLKDECIANNDRCLTSIDGYDDFVFLTIYGNPLMPSAYNNLLYNIVRSYNKMASARGIEPLPHISSHILRHTACTRLAMEGINPKALQYIMGHSNASITMDIYNHLNSKDYVRSEINRLDD